MSNQQLDSASELTSTFSVSELNRRAKGLLETHFPLIWVEGEISNISRPASGHWYFTLKDSGAQISCAMFKRRSAYVKFNPKVGDHLKIRAKVSLYEGRGDYQLIVEHMEQAGFGLLQKRFEELKSKLQSEGLFAPEAKQALPRQCRHLAVVTSPSGAAVRDVLSVLERRFPALPITIIPSPVQGDEAATQLVKAIKLADGDERFDTILLCRGGGSIEDLWSFNNEALARCIAACKTPIVSAVGHEVDFTVSDFVADLRAPTPSAAAELISADSTELGIQFARTESQLQRTIRSTLKKHGDHIRYLQKRLKHPREKLEQWHQRLDHIETRLTHSLTRKLDQNRQKFALITNRLFGSNPKPRIQQQRSNIQDLTLRLNRCIKQNVLNKHNQFNHQVSRLDLVSPLATINRGYSIARDAEGNVLSSIHSVNIGDKFSVRVEDGTLISSVKEKQPLS